MSNGLSTTYRRLRVKRDFAISTSKPKGQDAEDDEEGEEAAEV